ncbi:MAG: anti-sigma F factor [Clostridia bacterium]|nr:anti-sigma F factor [Clostridia bacterium]
MKKELLNEVAIRLLSLSVNEGVARSMVSSAVATLDPTIEEWSDIRCAVSEAVTNCIVHAYRQTQGVIYISVKLYADRIIQIEVRDKGCGIADVKEARQPLFTTDREGERSGMGFSVMETFMDTLKVYSRVGKGTRVVMQKRLSKSDGRRKISG